MTDRSKGRKLPCPKCGALSGVKVMYGYPSNEAFEAEQLGELVLGGCMIGEGDPTHACTECGHRWSVRAGSGRHLT